MTAIEPPTLRPLTLSQLLDRAIRLYRNHFLVFIGIIAVALVPLTILQYAVQVISFPTTQRAAQQLSDPLVAQNPLAYLAAGGSAMGGLNLVLIIILTYILVQCIATGVLAKAVEDSYLGRPITIIGSYRKVAGRLLPLLLAMVVAFFFLIALWLWNIVPCVGWLTGPGLLIFFSYIITPLIPTIVVTENKGHFNAILRAWDLSRRRFWWVLGFVVILAILSWAILFGPQQLVIWLSPGLIQGLLPAASSQTLFAAQAAVSNAIAFLFNLIYLPLHLTAVVLMYFDLRVRTEGFDLAMMAASSDGDPAVLEVTPDAPPPDQTQLITLNEAGYFAAISIGLLALCGILYGGLLAIFMVALGTSSRGF